MALRANRFGRQPELFVEGPRECLVRAVARVERDGQDVRRTLRKVACRFGQTAASHITHERSARRRRERARQMKTRHAGLSGDGLKRQLAGQLTFDKPEGFVRSVHDSSRSGTGPVSETPWRAT